MAAEGTPGELTPRLEVHGYEAGLLRAAVTYTDGDHSWAQAFTARRLTRDDVAAALGAAGLRLEPGSPAPTWLTAVPA